MTTITINNCVYKIHPEYDLYAGSKDGYIINIIKQIPHKGNKTHRGYLNCKVRKFGQLGFKHYQIHRFIWESFNGMIPPEMQIDHINDVKDDNRLCNLQLLTQQQNCKKAAKNIDYSFVKDTHKNRKCVKATNKNTNETSYYFSIYAVKQHLCINHSIIKFSCENQKYYKSGKSKRDGHWYTFEYIKEEDLPQNYIKSNNIRPRKKTHEQIKDRRKNYDTKDWKCPNCEKVLRNYSRFHHRKKCNSQQ